MDEELPQDLVPIARRLAFEGIPIAAIARGLGESTERVRDCLSYAVADGFLVEVPREDWPATARRADRLPSSVARENESDMNSRFTRIFNITPLQAGFLIVLLKREEATKEMLHHVVEQKRQGRPNRPNNPNETDPKMVDVVICLMRKRLKPFGIKISTSWGNGYYLTPENRKKANDIIDADKRNQDAGNS